MSWMQCLQRLHSLLGYANTSQCYKMARAAISTFQLLYFPSSRFPPSPQIQLTPATQVHDTRPLAARPNLTTIDDSVEKYVLPTATYETLPNSVLAWKKANHLGRFDPTAKSASDLAAERAARDAEILEIRKIAPGARVVLLPGDTRRGTVRFVGTVAEIPGAEGGVWVGVELDEPTGKNDGTVKGTRYFECGKNFGVFVRPEKVEVGDWAVLDDFDDEDMEEI